MCTQTLVWTHREGFGMCSIYSTTDKVVVICSATSPYQCYKLLHISLTTTPCCPFEGTYSCLTTYTCLQVFELSRYCSNLYRHKARHRPEEITNVTDACLRWLNTGARSVRVGFSWDVCTVCRSDQSRVYLSLMLCTCVSKQHVL